MELGELKKFFWALIILIGLGWYVRQHYTFRDVLAYAKSHPSQSASPALDYYSGMGFYLREDYDGAIEAFGQLLTDYPTCQYAPTALVRLSSSYMERNRWSEAKETLEKFIEQFPDDKNRPLVDQKYEYVKYK
ncbi:MAG: tetratricopeptide repeat protein [Elusimicrobia bacterium]|nr:tetratricopeptide repeat protein [Elusimicrobiota bacterium]